jgi:hypothetical protein
MFIAGATIQLTGGTANAVVHEIVAAYCSGGDHGTFEGWELEPPRAHRYVEK